MSGPAIVGVCEVCRHGKRTPNPNPHVTGDLTFMMRVEHCPRCTPPLECLDGPDGCEGRVELRWPGYGDRDWPRCYKHGEARVAREEAATVRNGNPDSPCPPPGFDPLAAGERWDDEW